MHRQEYNDVEAPYDQAIFDRLQQHGTLFDSTTADVNARRPDKRRCVGAGIDSILAKHISHLFIRDPIVIFSETIDQDDENSNDHFEVRRYGLRRLLQTLTMFYVSPEHPIHELADRSLQAAPSALHHRLAR